MKTKFYLNLKSWLLMMLMLIGVGGNVWAEETVAYTLDGTVTGGTNGYAEASKIDQNGLSWSVVGNTTQSPWRIGGKSLTKVDRTLYSKTAMNDAISKIEVEVGGASSITVNSFKLIVAGDAEFNSKLDEVTATFSANSTITFKPSSDTEWPSNAYYKFIFNVTVSGTSNKFIEFKKATFYKNVSGGDTPTKTDIATLNSISPTSLTVGDNGAFSLDATFADGVVANEDYEISWESDNAEVLTLNGSSYEAKKAGKANVTVHVTVLDDETYNEVERIFAVTVKDAPLANIAALSEKTEAGEYDVEFNGAVVTYVNGNYAYIQDDSGAIVMYKSGHGLTAGKVLNGTATVTYQVRNGNPQITALSGHTATDGTAPEPTSLKASEWNTEIASVLSQYFKITDATITQDGNKYYVQLGEENVQLYKPGSTCFVSDLTAKYTIVGFPTLYNTTLELQIFEDPQIQTYEITAATNNDGWGTAVYENGVITATPAAGYRFATPAYTVTSGTATVTQDGNEFVVDAETDCTVQINFEAIPTHTVTWSINGTETTTTALEDAAVEFPAAPEAIEGKTFVGWVTEVINGETDEVPTFVTSATMATSDLKYYAVFAIADTEGSVTEVTDEITASDLAATGTTYTDFSNVKKTSNAVYAGNSAKNSDGAIQLRSKNSNSGIVSTTSGGTVKSVTITVESGTNTIDIYGSNTAYTAASNLYATDGNSNQGTKIGSLTETGTVTFDGDYAYVGIRSNNGAVYLSNVSITWETGTPATYRGYCTTVDVPIRISNVEELKAFRDAVNTADKTVTSKNVLLVADLDLSGEENWTPIGNLVAYPGQSFDGVFDGNGHTIKNVTVVDQTTPEHAVAGLFGSVVNGTIKNLTVENVNLTSSHYAGGIVAYTSNAPTIENCHVKGGTITSVPEKLGDEYDNGDKVGGIFGYATAGSTINNCTVDGLTIKAYRDMGGIVGFSAGNVTNNTVKNTTIIQSDVNAYKNEEITTYDYIVGRNGSATLENNVYEELNNVLTIDGAVAKIGDKLYRKLQAAVDAATDDANVVTLLTDINLASDNVSINKAITINGDGHTITSSASAAVEVSGTGDVTISNTKIVATSGRGVQIGNLAHYSGKLTINEGSEITVAKRGINILDLDEGFELNVVNSIIQTNVEDPTTTYTTGEDSRGINFSNDPLAYNANITNTVIRGFSYDVNVYSGTENLTLTMVGGKSYGRDIINNWGKNNTFTLNGVEIHGLNNQTGPTEGFACVVDNEGSEHNTYVINNCQFIAVLSEAAMGEEGSSASEYMFALRGTNETVKVTGETTYTTNAPERGGFIESESQLAENTIYFDETAKGQFENSFVDYKVVTTETAPGFVVAVKEYVAQVGDVKYETLAEAVAAAENNTITLLANIADTYTLAEAQSLNVNLNGHTINVVAPEGYILQTSEADGVTTYSYVAPVAKIGETQFASLQAAVDAAQQLGGAQTINLLDNISDETVTIKEVANFQLTIDGKKDAESNYTVDAVIVVDGLRGNGGSTTNGASVTLQNIAFVKTTSTDGIQASHYPHHLTIQDCTYSGSDNDKWFLNASVDGPLYGVTVKNVTVEHARLIYANMADDAVFQNITATNDVKVGFNVKTSGTALIENCQVTTGKYAFRDYSDAYEGSFTLKDNTFISTSEASDEGVIVNRGGTVGTAHINVESGTYSGHIKVLNNKEGVLAISGGIFSESIAEAYCADGYICVANPDTETSEAYPYAVAPRPYVAQIGETQYYSLADAIAAVPADGTETTITMIDNEMVNVVGYAITIPSTKNVVIDLNGFQVVGTAGEAGTSALIRNLGTLTIKDSSDTKKDGTGTGKLISGASPTWTWDGTDDYSGSYASNLIRNEKDLIVESGLLYTMSKGSAAYAIDNYSAGNITINGGKVDAAKASAVRMFYVNGGSITVNDGVIGHYNSDEDYSYMGVQVMSGTNVNVSVAGGTIAGSYALYANNTGGSLAISGGIFDGYVGIAAAVPNDILSISGGTFNEWVGTWGDQTKFISGGTYSMKPDAEYIADGYIAAQQGNVYVVIPESDMPSAPTIFHDEGTYEGTLDVAIAGQGTIMYKLGDSEAQAYSAPFEISETTKVTAWAEQDGIKSAEVSKTFTIVEAQKGPSVTDGYYNIMTNDGKYVNVAGRKTVTLVDDNEGMPGTVIRVKATDGKVETLRSQGVDVPSYAQKAMNYVPEIVQLAVDKLHAEGAGELLGETGLEKIMDKFNESFDYNLYLEKDGDAYRIYGRTPSMKPVVDFYAENKANVDAKLPELEEFINKAIQKVLQKTNGSGASVLVPFSLQTIWERMDSTLTNPADDEAKFYEEVLSSEANVWNFAYQTAMLYWGNLKNHPRFAEIQGKLGDYSKYIDKVENIRPNFRYYIVPSASGVDFISQGNSKITDASTAWTMEPVSEFKANFDVKQEHKICPTQNGGEVKTYSEYYTTLYTDFAYTLPEGVKAYKVTEITEKYGVAKREEITGVIPAQTPVLLVTSNKGAQTLTLTTEAGTAVTGNLLVGADALINEYQIKTPQVVSLFEMANSILGESAYKTYLEKYEHLMLKNAGTVGNKYFFGLTTDDLGKCADDEGLIPVRSLDSKDSEACFCENWQAGANKAFLVTEKFDPVKLFLVGDVNRDGNITIADVTALVNIILGKATYPEDNDKYDFAAANVNSDNAITISDVTALVNIILGK